MAGFIFAKITTGNLNYLLNIPIFIDLSRIFG